MSGSTLSRAAIAVTLLASTANAAFNAGSTANVAMYWGQGPDQAPLTTACADDSIDVVNIGFVNGFATKQGDWPATNFGNACYDYYKHPTDSTQDKKMLKTCPSIESGIKLCQKNGKKVLLSLGGGAPTTYYLASEAMAKYNAEFLMGAFGPVTPQWTAKNGPRPFGDSFVDGFDLDLEAEVGNVPRPDDIKAHYAYFVNQLKAIQPSLLISAAPQCEVPDVRLADAIKGAPFDMIFTQFYNTPKCSARAGITRPNDVEGFSFKKWADWLQTNSRNSAVKLYIGLPASPAAAPSYPDHYLTPNEAYTLANQWKAAYPNRFGGIMLWEDKRSRDNEIFCGNYGSWMKAILNGTFRGKFKASNCITSSSIVPSSTPVPSSASSSVHSSTPSASSSVHTPSASSSVHTPSASSSVHTPSASSSVHTPSASSSVHTPSASSSVHTPSASSVHTPSASSSVHTPSASSIHTPSASSSTYEVSSTPIPHPSGNITYGPYPTGTATPSIVYPADTTKLYPHSSETLTYPSSASSVHYPIGNATTPCSSSTVAPSSTPGYPVYVPSSKSAPVYEAPSSTPGYGNEYPPSVTSAPGKDYPSYPGTSTEKTITTTFIDSCETGITTKTETITQTVCNKCKDDSVTSTYVCHKCGPSVTTYTITKPAPPPTNVPSVPTYPAKPSTPSHGGEYPPAPAKPSTPSHGSDKPSYPEGPKKHDVPTSTTVTIVYVTKTPVPVVPVPYPSAPAHNNGTSPYPVKPTGSGAVVPPTKPTGTGAPTKPTTYTPPAQFTGAASQVGASLLAVVAAGFLVL